MREMLFRVRAAVGVLNRCMAASSYVTEMMRALITDRGWKSDVMQQRGFGEACN